MLFRSVTLKVHHRDRSHHSGIKPQAGNHESGYGNKIELVFLESKCNFRLAFMYCKSFLSLPVNCFCPSDSLGFFPFIYLIYNLSMVPTYLSILGDVAPLPSWIYSCVAFCEESIQQFAAPLGIFFSNYSPKLQVNNMDLLVECK